MKYPSYLKDKGSIDLVAPSFGANIDPYKTQVKRSISLFQQMGYTINEGENIFAGKGIGISNSPSSCANELMNAYCNDSDCIISVGGGEMMCTVLPYLDFEKISQATPKWFMGFSDNTNFSFVLTTGYDVASISGQNFGSFALIPKHRCIDDALRLLKGDMDKSNTFIIEGYDKWEYHCLKDANNCLVGYNLDTDTNYAKSPSNFNGTICGRLLVGTLDCLLTLCGTQFDHVASFCEKYKEDGIVWVLDACELTPFALARGLWQLKNAGWFKYVNGFIFGKSLTAYGQETLGMNAYNAITNILESLNVPIIMDFEYGHFEPSMPFINGSYVSVTIDGNHSVVTMETK